METRSTSSTVLIVILLIITFPIWIGIAGGMIGLIAGLFGGAIGIIAGIFGAVIGGIASLFGALFHFSWGSPFSHIGSIGMNLLIAMGIVAFVIMVTRRRRSS